MKHGTLAGYTYESENGLEHCDDCRAARAQYMREHRRKRGAIPRGPLAPCGTHAAYARHLRHGEEPCFKCKVAHTEYMAEYRAKRRKEKMQWAKQRRI